MRPSINGIVLALLVSAGFASPSAAADATVPLGGGAGITVNDTLCTLAAIGHDNSGELVGITAAHCGDTGSQVAAEASGTRVGSVVASDHPLDYAVIRFDPTKVIPLAAFNGFPINGIGLDPGPNQPACIQGAATGQGCGSVKLQTLISGDVGASVPAWRPGDDGAPVTVEGQLVGVTRKGVTMADAIVPRIFTHIEFTLISAILNDVNAKGGPGAGFTPIPA